MDGRGLEVARAREATHAHALRDKIVHGLTRDRGLSLGARLRKGALLLVETAAAHVYLRGCNRVGRGARAKGRPRIENGGKIEIGDGLVITSTYSPVELVTEPGGRIEIGDEVWLNFGTAIAARRLVRIGDRSHVGQYSIIADTDLPAALGDEPLSIEIGKDVWIAGRVTVLPGSVIGDRSVITAGSVVSGTIPPDVVAGGAPARVVRTTTGSTRTGPDVARPGIPRKDATPARHPPVHRVLIVADFTADDIARFLEEDGEEPGLTAKAAPFGQVAQTLLARADDADILLVWTRPEGAVSSFARALGHEKVEETEVLAEVDAFCAMVQRGASGARAMFVPTWTLPPWHRGLGMRDARDGATRLLTAMNLRLMEGLAAVPNVMVLDAQRWLAGHSAGYSPKLWYLGKIPFTSSVYEQAAQEMKAALRGLAGEARKLVVLDLDDTLWGGIVGEVGWENLNLGGHDGEGEAFVDFQRALKSLTRRGVLLAIVSKNEESVALDAIRKHPEMALREDDFVGWRINWQDKANNIADLAAELNLGPQSIVFIDDNPAERLRVRMAMPEVFVPEWPEDKVLYPSALQALRCFDSPALTSEDETRTQLYAAERRRNALQKEVGSVDEWLHGLDLRVRAEPVGPHNLARATQLMNKTNQMNLATRRVTEDELRRWAAGAGRSVYAVSVSDRFGDAGLTGLLSLQIEGPSARIVDFVLSCRVMGRRVEETMLHLAITEALADGAGTIEAIYVPTPKNMPCLGFWRSCGFTAEADGRFVWDLERPYECPQAIKLEVAR